ncbi:cbb3-type cytochrome oxidase assembly protein CcoS [Novosphingobium profundi]|uniref:cbb3-type cytochrome oxidase assembly protein CcoS n=1 Tax=Novosphingobium profundi TaxID=1774954 RepID=UPI001BDA625C|nr:cbb3-type cytochrome oxidase assembly protein CcoS [Novosphingobium profundi]
MNILGFLIPLALVLGMAGLGAFFWAMKSGQFEDLDGAANRILIEDEGPAEPRSDEGEGARPRD